MKKKSNSKLKIIPLGGLEKIGMNITAFEYEDSIIVVDCGLSFPEDDMLGIDLVIPDISYLKSNADKVKGFVITHGHEDHIGALPYVLKEINLPIYTTKLTMGIIEKKLTEHNLLRSTKRKVVRHGQSINLGKFRIEFIKTNHSIQDASALAIYSPAGIVVHTGDFKVDYTPVFGDAIDLQRFAELGKKGVLAMLADRTIRAFNAAFTLEGNLLCEKPLPSLYQSKLVILSRETAKLQNGLAAADAHDLRHLCRCDKLCSHSTSCFKVICLGLCIFYSHSFLQVLCNTHLEYIFYYTHTRCICQAFRK